MKAGVSPPPARVCGRRRIRVGGIKIATFTLPMIRAKINDEPGGKLYSGVG